MEQRNYITFELDGDIVDVKTEFVDYDSILLLVRKLINMELLPYIFLSLHSHLIKTDRKDEASKLRDDFLNMTRDALGDVSKILHGSGDESSSPDDDEAPIVDPEEVFAIGGPKDA